MFCPFDGTKMWLVEAYDHDEFLYSCGSHEWLEFEDADGLSVLEQQEIVPPLPMFSGIYSMTMGDDEDDPIQVGL